MTVSQNVHLGQLNPYKVMTTRAYGGYVVLKLNAYTGVAWRKVYHTPRETSYQVIHKVVIQEVLFLLIHAWNFLSDIQTLQSVVVTDILPYVAGYSSVYLKIIYYFFIDGNIKGTKYALKLN